jgi:hypothetical protein
LLYYRKTLFSHKENLPMKSNFIKVPGDVSGKINRIRLNWGRYGDLIGSSYDPTRIDGF